MLTDKFDRLKRYREVRKNVLYDPSYRLSGVDGELDLDDDLEALVIRINLDASVLTGFTCQGHFKCRVDPEGGDEFDNWREFKVGVDQPFTDEPVFMYDPGRVVLGIRDDSKGNVILDKLKDWVDSREGNAYIDELDEWDVVRFCSLEIHTTQKTRRFNYEDILRLDAIRTENIQTFEQSLKSILQRNAKWEKSDTITVNRKGRVPEECDAYRLKLKKQPIPIELGVHLARDGNIIIHQPGFYENADGYKFKYRSLGEHMQSSGYAFIRMDCKERDFHTFTETLYDDLRFVIEYALKKSRRLCKSRNPSIYLMGYSMGTNSVAAVAHEYSQVQKILLMGAAPDNSSFDAVKEGLPRFTGDVYIVEGDGDEYANGKIFHDLATSAGVRELVTIPGVDHHFKRHDEVYSQAPLWAFRGDVLDATKGVKLVVK